MDVYHVNMPFGVLTVSKRCTLSLILELDETKTWGALFSEYEALFRIIAQAQSPVIYLVIQSTQHKYSTKSWSYDSNPDKSQNYSLNVTAIPLV